MKTISLNARVSHDAEVSAEIEVALIRITHEDLDAPVLLSTDPTEVLTYDPLTYGTWSNWGGTENAYLFALVGVTPPGDPEDGPPNAALVFENVDNDISKLLRETTGQAVIDIAVVLASTPDTIEVRYTGFKLLAASGDAGTVSLTISREPITAEPWPAGRMTRQRFPALFR